MSHLAPDAQAFAKVFAGNSEAGTILSKAHAIVKAAPYGAAFFRLPAQPDPAGGDVFRLIGPAHLAISSTTNLARYSGDLRSSATPIIPSSYIPDLAVANRLSNNVSVLLGNGDGTFQVALNFAADTAAFVAVGKFRGVGMPDDLAVANEGSSFISVLLGNGDGTFQAERRFGADDVPESVAVGDFNSDGVQDLAVANFGSDDVSVLLGNGDGDLPSGAAISYWL